MRGMIRDTIDQIIQQSVASLAESGDLPDVPIPPIEVMRPQIPAHGDYATSVAMKLAAAARSAGIKVNPHAIAELIADQIRETIHLVPAYDLVDSVEVAGPGFINLRLKSIWLLLQPADILSQGDRFGTVQVGRGSSINLEFVSANPTGPVSVGNGRGAFIGDTLGSLMRSAGFLVTKEYYFNDSGGQIDKLGRSVEYYLQLALGDTLAQKPEEGYLGPYYETVAQRLLEQEGRSLLELAETERMRQVGGE